MQEHCPDAAAVDREGLVHRHLPLVRRVARRHAGRLPVGVELDDLVSWGTLGLLAAVQRYHPSRDAMFPAYARFRIRGAILDQLRQYDWTPRSVREKAAAVARATRGAERRLGRSATEGELAAALGLSLAAYRALLEEVAPVALVGLDEVDGGTPSGRPADGAGHDPLTALLAHERIRLLAEAVRRLPEREQLVLSLYYREELTMKEVGTVLGVTESRVSQLHTQALLRVRALLGQSARSGASVPLRPPLKVRAPTTDESIGAAWERPGTETPCARRSGAADSSACGSASAAGGTSSMRMPRRARSSRRCAAAVARSEPSHRADGDPAAG